MPRGCINRQLFSFALGMLLPLGQALGQADGDPKAKANQVLEDQLTESKDGLLLLDGKPFSGEVAKYHSNKKKAESYSLKKGKLHGPFITYREDGSLAFQVTFADGIEHGPFKRWFEDGKLWVEENYAAGKLEGISQTYFSNGKLQVQSLYRAGKKEGLEIGWYENGQQRWEVIYEKGRVKNKLLWERDGTPSGKNAPTIL